MSAANPATEPHHLLEAEEVRGLIRARTTATVYRLAREGRIGGVVRVGRLIRFDPDRLREWIRAGGTGLGR